MGHVGEVGIVMDADQLTAILAQIESLDYQPNEARERGVLAGFVFLTHRVKNSCKTRLKNT